MDENVRLYRDATGKPMVETRFRVRFFETDAMGVVHHASYITWFEEGRSAYTRAMGYPYAVMSSGGTDLAVVELEARYQRSARYDDEVIVVTWLQDFRSRGITFGYEVRCAATNEVLVTGSTKHLAVDRAGRVRRLPDEARERLLGGPEQ
jgi:acyl-CoA thioester hydrolase